MFIAFFRVSAAVCCCFALVAQTPTPPPQQASAGAISGLVVDRVPRLARVGAHFKQFLRDKLIEHKQYICCYGDDMPEIRHWKWPY